MTYKQLTFEELPNAVSYIANELKAVKELIQNLDSSQLKESREILLNVEEAAKFLSLAVPTIYAKVSKKELPSMKRGKKLYFSSLELANYLKEGRKETSSEILENASQYIITNKRRS